MTTQLRRFSEKDLPINTQHPLVLDDYRLNTSLTSLNLAGLYYEDYATPVSESLVWLTENFAGPNPPANAIKGQCWYKTDTKLLYVYDGEDARNGGDSTVMGDWILPIDVSSQTIANHISDTANPHQVTKTQVGLGNVINSLQLQASSNLGDLPDKTQARTNLNVYDKAYIDANFAGIGSTVGNSTLFNGLNSGQFIRSDVNGSTPATLTFTAQNALVFSQSSGTPISIDNGDVKLTVHDGTGNFNVDAGINVISNVDVYRTTGDGAVKTTWNYAQRDGEFSVSVAPIGTVGNTITYSQPFSVNKNGVFLGSNKLLDDSGFTTKGNILPVSTSSLDIGSSTLNFNNVYATGFKGTADNATMLGGMSPDTLGTANTIVERTSTGDIRAKNFVSESTTISDADLTSTAQMVFKVLSSGALEYASKTGVQSWLNLPATFDAVKSLAASNGAGSKSYVILPPFLGGLILQFGVGKLASGSETITFPYTFPNAALCMFATDICGTSPTNTGMSLLSVELSSLTTTGAKVYGFYHYTGAVSNTRYSWLAIGY